MRGDISARGYRLHRAESGDRHPGHPGRYGAGSLIPRGGHNIPVQAIELPKHVGKHVLWRGKGAEAGIRCPEKILDVLIMVGKRCEQHFLLVPEIAVGTSGRHSRCGSNFVYGDIVIATCGSLRKGLLKDAALS